MIIADETIEKLIYELDAKIDKAVAGFNKVEQSIDNVDKKVSLSSKTMEKAAALASKAWAAVALAISAALGYAVKFATGSSMDMEGYITKMTGLYGSVDVAREKLQWLYEFAKNTPFELPGLIEAAASLKAYGIDFQDTIEVLGDTASSLPGKTIDDAVQMLSDAQTGQFERLAEFGMKAVEITSKNFAKLGAAEADVGRTALTYVTKQGEDAIKVIDRDNRDQITSSITDILGSLYGGGMAAQAQTAAAVWSNVKDSVFQAANSFMGLDKATMTFREGSLFDRMKDGLQGLLDTLNNIDFSKAGQGVEKFLNWIDKGKEILQPWMDIEKRLGGAIAGIVKDIGEGLGTKVATDLGGLKTLAHDLYIGFLLIKEGFTRAWEYIDKHDIATQLAAPFRTTLEVISMVYQGIHDGIIWAISEVVKQYNNLVPVMQKLGMDVETVSLDAFAPLAKSAGTAADEVKTSMDDVVATTKTATDQASEQTAQQQEIIPGARASYASILGVDTAKRMGLSGVYGSMGYPDSNTTKAGSTIPAAQPLPQVPSGQPTSQQQQVQSKYAEIINQMKVMTEKFTAALKTEPRKVDADIKFDMVIKTDQDVKKLERTIKQATNDGVHGKLHVV
ncbi:hypothetical protein [Methanosarcina sp.]|uniref:hypothetical protein n=1 Tax=Methanosarcina sp. TaxID=2213 RepID=UPI003BB7BE21